MNFLQRSKSYGALLSLIFLACTNAVAQTKTVSGLVKSGADNTPFAGVSVQVKGGTSGAYSDENGKYSLPGVAENATLVFTATGFLRQEVPVAGKTTIDITLHADATGLNEVILPGSEIGELAAYARRKGTSWFIAVMNGKGARKISIPLSFLKQGGYKGILVKDIEGGVKVENKTFRPEDSIGLELGSGSGFIGELQPFLHQ